MCPSTRAVAHPGCPYAQRGVEPQAGRRPLRRQYGRGVRVAGRRGEAEALDVHGRGTQLFQASLDSFRQQCRPARFVVHVVLHGFLRGEIPPSRASRLAHRATRDPFRSRPSGGRHLEHPADARPSIRRRAAVRPVRESSAAPIAYKRLRRSMGPA